MDSQTKTTQQAIPGSSDDRIQIFLHITRISPLTYGYTRFYPQKNIRVITKEKLLLIRDNVCTSRRHSLVLKTIAPCDELHSRIYRTVLHLPKRPLYPSSWIRNAFIDERGTSRFTVDTYNILRHDVTSLTYSGRPRARPETENHERLPSHRWTEACLLY